MLEVIGGLLAETVGAVTARLFGRVFRPILRLSWLLVLIAAFVVPVAYWYFST